MGHADGGAQWDSNYTWANDRAFARRYFSRLTSQSVTRPTTCWSSSATIGAMIAPSLWPSRPKCVLSISGRVRRYASKRRRQ